jgi:hypothetical protein
LPPPLRGKGGRETLKNNLFCCQKNYRALHVDISGRFAVAGQFFYYNISSTWPLFLPGPRFVPGAIYFSSPTIYL